MKTSIKALLGGAFIALGLAAANSASACPNYNLSPTYGAYNATGSQLYSRSSFSLQAGGNFRIPNCGYVRPRTDRGDGYVTEAPDFSFNLSGMGRYQLYIEVVSACDAVLLINTGSVNWYYDDDDNPNSPGDPRISLTRPSNGRIDVWVGTYDGSVCDATLYLETYYR